MFGWKWDRCQLLPACAFLIAGLRDLVRNSEWKPARPASHFRRYFVTLANGEVVKSIFLGWCVRYLRRWNCPRVQPRRNVFVSNIQIASRINSRVKPSTAARGVSLQIATSSACKRINTSSWLWIYKTLYFVALVYKSFDWGFPSLARIRGGDILRRETSVERGSRAPAKRQEVTNATTAYGILLLLCVWHTDSITK